MISSLTGQLNPFSYDTKLSLAVSLFFIIRNALHSCIWNRPQNRNNINNFYRLQRKLQEGNVFIGVCLSTGEVTHVTITHDALDLTGTYPLLVTSSGHHWRQGTYHSLRERSGGYPHSLGEIRRGTPASDIWRWPLKHTVSKRAVRILLECLLVVITKMLDCKYLSILTFVHLEVFFKQQFASIIFLWETYNSFSWTCFPCHQIPHKCDWTVDTIAILYRHCPEIMLVNQIIHNKLKWKIICM